MDDLPEQFEANRSRLRAVAYRMLGSQAEAEDAVQEAWLRLSRSDADKIENLGGWLTTVVARVCLNMLAARREQPVGLHLSEAAAEGADPEHEALLADSIGPALLVILHTLAPAERLAFVLHDMFAVPFDDIAPVVGRSPAAARQLASRARRRVQGVAPVLDTDLTRQRAIVNAFLTAARDGDFDALLEALDPDVVVRSNGAEVLMRGAAAAANRARGGARYAQVSLPALINGAVGVVIAAEGMPVSLLAFTITNGKIAEVDVIDDPGRIAEVDLAILDRLSAGPGPPLVDASPGADAITTLRCQQASRPGDHIWYTLPNQAPAA